MTSTTAQAFRLSAATGLHKGDRAYQQDQVEIMTTAVPRAARWPCVADGMGGKSGGRKAADQVLLTGRQVFERYVPAKDDAGRAAAASW
jgi:serine/threonine protein phosphatase PrpC